MKLRRNEYCPIHRSVLCCSREQVRKVRILRLGVQRIEDPHHPRGYRELRSPAEMRKLLNRKIVEQDKKCAICHEVMGDNHTSRATTIRIPERVASLSNVTERNFLCPAPFSLY